MKYAGVSFVKLKEMFMPTIDEAYDSILDLSDEIQGKVIGAGVDGNGPYMKINENATKEQRDILEERFKKIKDLKILYGDIPTLL